MDIRIPYFLKSETIIIFKRTLSNQTPPMQVALNTVCLTTRSCSLNASATNKCTFGLNSHRNISFLPNDILCINTYFLFLRCSLFVLPQTLHSLFLIRLPFYIQTIAIKIASGTVGFRTSHLQ